LYRSYSTKYFGRTATEYLTNVGGNSQHRFGSCWWP